MAKRLPAYPDVEFEVISLPLRDIVQHPVLSLMTQVQSNCVYWAQDANLVNTKALSFFITLHPFIIVQHEKGYYCISNPRLLQLAKLIINDGQEIVCRLYLGLDENDIQTIAAHDFYLSHLFFSLRSDDAGAQLLRVLKEDQYTASFFNVSIKYAAASLDVDSRVAYLKRKPRKPPTTPVILTDDVTTAPNTPHATIKKTRAVKLTTVASPVNDCSGDTGDA